uniref:Putative secreted protein n=1 Tax=Anopheles triannulatus TaxID=58253 RepID=A0A2M4B1U2_9DIPT
MMRTGTFCFVSSCTRFTSSCPVPAFLASTLKCVAAFGFTPGSSHGPKNCTFDASSGVETFTRNGDCGTATPP